MVIRTAVAKASESLELLEANSQSSAVRFEHQRIGPWEKTKIIANTEGFEELIITATGIRCRWAAEAMLGTRNAKFPGVTAHNQIRDGNILAHRASHREGLFLAKSATCTFMGWKRSTILRS